MKTCLAYDDIQIIPNYSEILSRTNIKLHTQYTRQYSIDIPVIATPMDTICEFDMAKAMIELGGVGIIHRFMPIKNQVKIVHDLNQFISSKNYNVSKYPISAAIGVTGDYFMRATSLVSAGCKVLLLDVANGDHILVKTALNLLKKEFGDKVDIIAGNIATKNAALRLTDWGADAIRVGIGNGCFTPDMVVITDIGKKLIKDINPGDTIISHNGTFNKVINTFEYDRNEEIVEINGIECTKNHLFYVLHKKYKNIVTEDNIQKYAEWIPAKNLTKKYLLIDVA